LRVIGDGGEGSEREVLVTPEVHEERGRRLGRIGIQVKDAGIPREDLTVRVSYGPVASLGKALRETWEKSVFSLVMMGKMVVGEVSWRNLSGPVTIADYAGQSARLGIEYYLKFLALVSISLGVLNLLPIPILDGGHLMYYVVEIIKRGPVSERSMEIGQQIGMALLLMLMAFAFYNDINRLISG
jgi:regulator of sigma E protease